MAESRHPVLAVVKFLTASGRWAAGTTGTVVEADGERALVEVADDRGRPTDFVSLPHGELASVGHGTTRAV